MGTGNKENKKKPPKNEEKEQQEEDSGNKEKIHEQIDEVKIIWTTWSILLLNHTLLLIPCVSENLKCFFFNSEAPWKKVLFRYLRVNYTVSIIIHIYFLIHIQERISLEYPELVISAKTGFTLN